MTAKKAGLRRAVAATVAVVLALGVVGSVAAGKKPGPAPSGDKTPPTAPTNLRVTSLGQTSVTLAWNASTDNMGSVTYSVVKDGQGFTVPQGQTTYTIDWLSPGRSYSFYVVARDNSLNQSPPSNTVSVTTARDTSPPTPPELSGFVRGPSQVRLTWTRSTDDITWWTLGYRVYVNGAPATHVNWYGERDVVLRHLTPATTYTFTVEANDFNGNTTMSNPVTLTTTATSDVTPPSVPTNVRIVGGFGCPEFFVGWTQSTDDTDPQNLIEYEIYVNGVLSPLAVSAGVDNDFVYATDSGANTFTVKAVDQAGNTSAASDGVTEFC
jgi:chitodextrinase